MKGTFPIHTRTVGNYCFASVRHGGWHIVPMAEKDTLGSSSTDLWARPNPDEASQNLALLYSHLGTGPSTFNVGMAVEGVPTPSMQGHIVRFLDIAFMTTSQHIHVEWDWDRFPPSSDSLALCSGWIESKKASCLKHVSHSLRFHCAHGPGVMALATELGMESRPWGNPDEFAQWGSPEKGDTPALPGSSGTLLIRGQNPIPKPSLDALEAWGFQRVRVLPRDWEDFSFSLERREALGAEYTAFFAEILGRPKMRELNAAEFLSRLLHGREPLCAETRNPSGAGRSLLALETTGDVYTCRRGRLLSQSGIDEFRLGHVQENGYHDLVTHSSTRALVLATTLLSQPGWSDNPYETFAAVDPILTYVEQGSIHGRMKESEQCHFLMAVYDACADILANPTVLNRDILEDWGTLQSFGSL